MQKNLPDYYNNLNKVYLKIWDLLNIGLLNRNIPYHIPVSICGSGKNFDGRTVVLRGIDKKNQLNGYIWLRKVTDEHFLF